MRSWAELSPRTRARAAALLLLWYAVLGCVLTLGLRAVGAPLRIAVLIGGGIYAIFAVAIVVYATGHPRARRWALATALVGGTALALSLVVVR